MTSETLWLIAVGLGGFWLRSWTGPVATRLRELLKIAPAPAPVPPPDGTPTPAPAPVPGGIPWDTIRKLIPDVPGPWDDLARAAVDALAKKVQAAPEPQKATIVRRLLDMIQEDEVDEPRP